MSDVHAADGRSIFSFGELGFQEIETNRYLIDILKKNGFTRARRASPASRPRSWRRWGSGKPVHRARLRHRRHPAGVAEAGRRLPRADDRRRARARRRPQLRAGGEHHRGDRGEEDHGAREAARHDPDLAGDGRGARRHQGVLRPRRLLQGRRRRALHARRQRPRRVVGRPRRHRARVGRVHVHAARPRTPPARRGAAAARSTPSS